MDGMDNLEITKSSDNNDTFRSETVDSVRSMAGEHVPVNNVDNGEMDMDKNNDESEEEEAFDAIIGKFQSTHL
eukprot:CAMPEP_0201571078 /NCGR_PEP_ID=MMETSP0190_2-20130828/13678_1 /ASSEMBLY_ACC=CAM_ASM_000263 /TAXON_ID=37353 /ORGANISM="Rosalina sp." /LENGTH=72 /DNA_ID=CAMNT_0047995349 /DNA_START=1 /DNA_END=219 /DNA_ORIENTATION=+